MKRELFLKGFIIAVIDLVVILSALHYLKGAVFLIELTAFVLIMTTLAGVYVSSLLYRKHAKSIFILFYAFNLLNFGFLAANISKKFLIGLLALVNLLIIGMFGMPPSKGRDIVKPSDAFSEQRKRFQKELNRQLEEEFAANSPDNDFVDLDNLNRQASIRSVYAERESNDGYIDFPTYEELEREISKMKEDGAFEEVKIDKPPKTESTSDYDSNIEYY